MGDRPDYRGLGPKNYRRSDERIHEDLCERLTHDPYIDVAEVSIAVRDGIVIMEGSVAGRPEKYYLEDIAETCRGVVDIQNRVMVSQRTENTEYGEEQHGNATQTRQ